MTDTDPRPPGSAADSTGTWTATAVAASGYLAAVAAAFEAAGIHGRALPGPDTTPDVWGWELAEHAIAGGPLAWADGARVWWQPEVGWSISIRQNARPAPGWPRRLHHDIDGTWPVGAEDDPDQVADVVARMLSAGW